MIVDDSFSFFVNNKCKVVVYFLKEEQIMGLLENLKKIKPKYKNEWLDRKTPDVEENKITGPVLAIDPGTTQSAFTFYDPRQHRLLEFGKIDNEELLDKLQIFRQFTKYLAIEGMQNYGSAVGKTTFDTCIMIGRYLQEWERRDGETKIIYRRQVKAFITPGIKSNDSKIRTALIGMFEVTGKDSKGSPSSIGVKRSPGPLYGVTADCWSALAIALTFCKKKTINFEKNSQS